eukprot:242741_1
MAEHSALLVNAPNPSNNPKEKDFFAAINDGDDPFMGNHVMKIISLSSMLSLFFVLAIPSFIIHLLYGPWYEILLFTPIIIGSIMFIVSSVVLILFFINLCRDSYARVAWKGLYLGGFLYGGAMQVYIIMLSTVDIDDISSSLVTVDEMWMSFLLCALLLIDVLKKSVNEEINRILELSVFTCIPLFMVSLLGSVGYGLVYCNVEVNRELFPASNNSIYLCMFIGYSLMSLISAIYLMAMCVMDSNQNIGGKDRICMGLTTSLSRIFIALILFISGVITTVGYCIFIYNFTLSDSDFYPITSTLYYIGYTILLFSYCAMCALNIAFDDVQF